CWRINPVGIAFPKLKKPNLVTQVVIGMLLGIVIGNGLPQLGMEIKPLADMFLRMIKMLLAPLIFSTLVVGIAGTGSHKTLGRLGAKTLLYFELATVPALFIGMMVANALRPGDGVDMSALSAKGA